MRRGDDHHQDGRHVVRDKPLEEDDVDLLRENVRVLARALMETEVSCQIEAAPYERTSSRTAYRNGYRARTGDTRVGTIEPRIPKVAAGTYFPSAAGAPPAGGAGAAGRRDTCRRSGGAEVSSITRISTFDSFRGHWRNRGVAPMTATRVRFERSFDRSVGAKWVH